MKNNKKCFQLYIVNGLKKITILLLGSLFLLAEETSCSLQAQNRAVGSIWAAPGKPVRVLLSDHIANRPGDLVTIVVNIQTTVARNNNTTTAKTTNVNSTITSLVYPQTDGTYDFFKYRNQNPTSTWNSAKDFNGGGSLANTESISTTIQARVVEVMSNGVFRIEARRQFQASEDKSDLILTGLIRKSDLDLNNSISSTKIADLQVKQEGTGPISREQKKGWLTQLYEFFTPF